MWMGYKNNGLPLRYNPNTERKRGAHISFLVLYLSHICFLDSWFDTCHMVYYARCFKGNCFISIIFGPESSRFHSQYCLLIHYICNLLTETRRSIPSFDWPWEAWQVWQIWKVENIWVSCCNYCYDKMLFPTYIGWGHFFLFATITWNLSRNIYCRYHVCILQWNDAGSSSCICNVFWEWDVWRIYWWTSNGIFCITGFSRSSASKRTYQG